MAGGLDSQGREYVVKVLSRARMLVTESTEGYASLTKSLISPCRQQSASGNNAA